MNSREQCWMASGLRVRIINKVIREENITTTRCSKVHVFVNVTVKALYMCNVFANRECSLITLGYLLPTRDDKMAAM